jgi:hypothetical protein
MSRLEFAFKVRAYHHNAIWEEQKHFTWFMSILLAAQLLALTSDKVDSTTRATVVSIAAFAGIALSLTGFRVQTREGTYFRTANELYIREYNRTFTSAEIPLPPGRANKSVTRLIIDFGRGRAGVRDYFQILFLSFALVFAALALLVLLRL